VGQGRKGDRDGGAVGQSSTPQRLIIEGGPEESETLINKKEKKKENRSEGGRKSIPFGGPEEKMGDEKDEGGAESVFSWETFWRERGGKHLRGLKRSFLVWGDRKRTRGATVLEFYI